MDSDEYARARLEMLRAGLTKEQMEHQESLLQSINAASSALAMRRRLNEWVAVVQPALDEGGRSTCAVMDEIEAAIGEARLRRH